MQTTARLSCAWLVLGKAPAWGAWKVVFISLPRYLCGVTPTISSPKETDEQTPLWPMQYGEQMFASHSWSELAFQRFKGRRRCLGNSVPNIMIPIITHCYHSRMGGRGRNIVLCHLPVAPPVQNPDPRECNSWSDIYQVALGASVTFTWADCDITSTFNPSFTFTYPHSTLTHILCFHNKLLATIDIHLSLSSPFSWIDPIDLWDGQRLLPSLWVSWIHRCLNLCQCIFIIFVVHLLFVYQLSVHT